MPRPRHNPHMETHIQRSSDASLVSASAVARLQLTNRSDTDPMSVKMATTVHYRDLFSVTPNPTQVAPGESLTVLVQPTAKAKDSSSILPVKTKLAIFSNMGVQQQTDNKTFKYLQNLTLMLTTDRKIIMKEEDTPLSKLPRPSAQSTPTLRGRRLLNGDTTAEDEALFSTMPLDVTASTIADTSNLTLGINATLQEQEMPPPIVRQPAAGGNFPHHTEEPPQITDDNSTLLEELAGEPLSTKSLTVAYTLVAVIVHILCFSLYLDLPLGELVSGAADYLNALASDDPPLLDDCDLFGPTDLRFYLGMASHFFWLASSCLLLLTLTTKRRLFAFPWFLTMLFSQLNLAALVASVDDLSQLSDMTALVCLVTFTTGVIGIVALWRTMYKKEEVTTN